MSLHDGTAVINPIGGTYRYRAAGPTVSGVVEFLSDRKETDELSMVVDEELSSDCYTPWAGRSSASARWPGW